MSTHEKLTGEERERLVLQDGGITGSNARKALRIIDQLTAALEAAEKRAEHNAEGIEFWSMRYTAANDRAEALQAEVARLTAALEASRSGTDTAADFWKQEHADGIPPDTAVVFAVHNNVTLGAIRESLAAQGLAVVTKAEADELADLRGRVKRAETEAIQRAWAAMGELTSYVVDGDHMVRVHDVRRTFERALEALRGR